MSEIITEEKDKIYKICDFSKKMAYRQGNENKTSKMYNENWRAKKLTEGKFTVLHVVPVHHCDMRTSPVTPPTGAHW